MTRDEGKCIADALRAAMVSAKNAAARCDHSEYDPGTARHLKLCFELGWLSSNLEHIAALLEEGKVDELRG